MVSDTRRRLASDAARFAAGAANGANARQPCGAGEPLYRGAVVDEAVAVVVERVAELFAGSLRRQAERDASFAVPASCTADAQESRVAGLTVAERVLVGESIAVVVDGVALFVVAGVDVGAGLVAVRAGAGRSDAVVVAVRVEAECGGHANAGNVAAAIGEEHAVEVLAAAVCCVQAVVRAVSDRAIVEEEAEVGGAVCVFSAGLSEARAIWV